MAQQSTSTSVTSNASKLYNTTSANKESLSIALLNHNNPQGIQSLFGNFMGMSGGEGQNQGDNVLGNML